MDVIIIWSFFQVVIFHMHCTITMGQNGQSLPTVGQYIAVCSASDFQIQCSNILFALITPDLNFLIKWISI